MGDHPIVSSLVALAAVLTAAGVVWRALVRPAVQLGRRMGDFLDDWNGQPARPGRPAIEPMPARIAKLEKRQLVTTEALEQLRAEVGSFQAESTDDRADLRHQLAELLGRATRLGRHD